MQMQLNQLDQIIYYRKQLEGQIEQLHARVHSSEGELQVGVMNLRNIECKPDDKVSLMIIPKNAEPFGPEELGMEKVQKFILRNDDIELLLKFTERKTTDDSITVSASTVEHCVKIKLLNKLVGGKLDADLQWYPCDDGIDNSSSSYYDATKSPQFQILLKFARKNNDNEAGAEMEKMKAHREELEKVEAQLRSAGLTSQFDNDAGGSGGAGELWEPIPKAETTLEKIIYPFRFGLGIVSTSTKVAYLGRALIMFAGGVFLFHYRGDDFAC